MQRKRTPLYDVHGQLGARIIDFGGWDMPVQYAAGTIKEHEAVRTAVGLFDVSHMGEFRLRGDGARAAVDKVATNACAAAAPGKAVYTLLCKPSGGVVDDCIFYKRSDTEFFVVVNAGNLGKDLEWLREHAASIACNVEDESDLTALIAVQGPKAVAMVDGITDGRIADMPSFTFTDAVIGGVKCVAARTGYTGEDGFELACAAGDAVKLWGALYAAATPLGGLPIGLGARDSLRLESKLPLYGNDLDEEHTPLEAGLGWAVKLDRTFIGADALRAQKAKGLERQLVGFTIDPALRAIARHGYPVVEDGKPIGIVTSGGPGIHVGKPVGLAYVPAAKAAAGTTLTIDCRGKQIQATVITGKFYKRATT